MIINCPQSPSLCKRCRSGRRRTAVATRRRPRPDQRAALHGAKYGPCTSVGPTTLMAASAPADRYPLVLARSFSTFRMELKLLILFLRRGDEPEDEPLRPRRPREWLRPEELPLSERWRPRSFLCRASWSRSGEESIVVIAVVDLPLAETFALVASLTLPRIGALVVSTAHTSSSRSGKAPPVLGASPVLVRTICMRISSAPSASAFLASLPMSFFTPA
mmetsp:Transcript_12044/g.27338  ORF Transcript_12044/g.27338 Transcript_12044/m.27338 type:complete len:219 (+) Transcript_12044:99-755(+)